MVLVPDDHRGPITGRGPATPAIVSPGHRRVRRATAVVGRRQGNARGSRGGEAAGAKMRSSPSLLRGWVGGGRRIVGAALALALGLLLVRPEYAEAATKAYKLSEPVPVTANNVSAGCCWGGSFFRRGG